MDHGPFHPCGVELTEDVAARRFCDGAIHPQLSRREIALEGDFGPLRQLACDVFLGAPKDEGLKARAQAPYRPDVAFGDRNLETPPERTLAPEQRRFARSSASNRASAYDVTTTS